MTRSAHDADGYPSIGLVGLARLTARLAVGIVTKRRSFDAGSVLRAWYQQSVQRSGSENLVIDLRFKRLLVVTGRALSQHVSAQAPCEHAYAAGPTKVRAMSFLAPKALTVASDGRWRRLRAFNEAVLRDAGSSADLQFTLAAVRDAFPAPVSDIDDVRRCMRETMGAVVFGPDSAPGHALDDIETLMRHVQHPGRRLLSGWLQGRRRRRLYSSLQARWDVGPIGNGLSLIDKATVLAVDEECPEEELVQQIPHWMFTFTGSGTDLLARTLGVLGSRDDAYDRVLTEMVEHDPAADASALMRMEYLRACLLEVCRLFPPVTRTLIAARGENVFEGSRVPAGTEIVNCFAEHHRDVSLDASANDFRPERWLEPDGAAAAVYPSLFLGGARECPGRDLILVVCMAAMCALMDHGRIQTRCDALAHDPMPRSFPDGGLRYQTDTHRVVQDKASKLAPEEEP